MSTSAAESLVTGPTLVKIHLGIPLFRPNPAGFGVLCEGVVLHLEAEDLRGVRGQLSGPELRRRTLGTLTKFNAAIRLKADDR